MDADPDQYSRSSKKATRGSKETLLGTHLLNVDRARSFWLAKRGGRLAIDFEAWGRDHTVLLEFGYSSVQWCDVQKAEEKCHLIVEEHEKYFSGCVPSFREVRPPE